jgi:hypothetical protein
MRVPKPLRVLAKLGAVFVSVSTIVVIVMEWRAGTAFERRRNWRAQSFSDADGLIVMVIVIAVFIVGGAWSWWERRREERFLKQMREKRGPGTRQ